MLETRRLTDVGTTLTLTLRWARQVVEIQCIDTYVPADAYSVATVVDGVMSGR